MRVFIGIQLPVAVRSACAAGMQELGMRMQGRWTLEENLHVTLAFIGEIEPSRIGEIEAIMEETVARFAAPEMALDGVGVFEKKRDAIVHARVQSTPSAAPLHEFLIASLQEAGFPVDPGPFSPHITLARKAQIPGGIETLAETPLPQAVFVPAQLTLFESARDAQNVLRYTPIRCCGWRNDAKLVEF